ncbi:hypothetical protein [Streptomyces sp. NPDC047829]|uniref:hypothetical protein n=1 Tax=Streptomyces sp. NPDC047829 TaxID=3154609 RepID=UPI0033CA8F6F
MLAEMAAHIKMTLPANNLVDVLGERSPRDGFAVEVEVDKNIVASNAGSPLHPSLNLFEVL